MGIYDFRKEDALRFKDFIGGMAKQKGNELEFGICPYCHGGEHRDKGTFSINLETGQFECKRSSCNAHGNMITLARDFNFELSEDVSRYFNQDNFNGRFKRFADAHRKIDVRPAAVDYLIRRGISQRIAEQYEITTQKNNDKILVFPFKDESGELRFIKYRNTEHIKGKGSKEWTEKDCMPILFGMNHCKDRKRLVITEGQIDSLSVSESGIDNAVSVPIGCNGFTWIPHCWDFVNRFEEIVVFGDFENRKMTLLPTISKRFGHKRILAVRPEDYQGCKDANEILQKFGAVAIQKAVNGARPLPVKQIKQLADVESVDIESMEHVKTNIKPIDEIITGMYFGQLILITGRRGDGKSTFMSQLICECLEQDYKTFIYSGELIDFHFKRWIDLQVAGKLVKINVRDDGKEVPFISNSDIDRIDAWYRDRAYLYDNSVCDGDELDDLITVAENAIKQYDCRVICVDNLMTALEVNPKDDLYRVQSTFVGRLARLAKAYNVIVILVAHPRKTGDRELTNDDISGSADITNKCDVVMQYSRPADDEDANTREFSIMKNRLTGRLTKKKTPIILKYSETSKRIVAENGSFERKYSLFRAENEPNDDFESIDDMEIPF